MSHVVDSFDSGLHGATWDSGLEWDVTIGPNPGDVAPYLAKITSEHKDLPRFTETLRAILQPLADIGAVITSMPAAYDLDQAAAAQLDTVGLWVGVTRDLAVPLTNVYFTLDSPTLGLDQGSLMGPFDPAAGLVSLPDDGYRTLLRARIAANQWNGTIPGAYAAWDKLFAGTGFGIIIQDLPGMHMLVGLTGSVPDAITLALFTSGDLNIKPAGVRIDWYMTPAQPNVPYFGLDMNNAVGAGLDQGYFGALSPGA